MIRKLIVTILVGVIWMVSSLNIMAESKPVGITPDIMSISVNINGEMVEFKRNQDNDATVNPAFAKTSRPCPPFCIQPSNLATGVETIGEVELMHYAKEMNEGDESITVIDSRTPDWVARGTVPTAMNVPWTNLNRCQSKDFPVLHATSIPFDLMRWITQSQKIFDIVR